MDLKIFIVTSGDYSDYRIENVFLDKQVAEQYAILKDGEVQEFEPADNRINIDFSSVMPYTVLTIRFAKYHTVNSNGTSFADLSTWLFDLNADMFEEKRETKAQESFSCRFEQRNSLLDEEYNTSSDKFENNEFRIDKEDPHDYTLTFRRAIPYISEPNKEALEQKYKKIAEDTFYQCVNLHEVEGWTAEMITEWLKEKFPIRKPLDV